MLQSRARWVIVAAAIAAAGCGSPTPQPPVINPPAGSETIAGTERIGWDQRAGDAAELAAIRYAMYVDGTRVELGGVTCATAATAAGYACTARLPAMTTGSHTLELASFIQDATVLESARSAPLRVTVTGAAAPDAGR